MVWSCVSQSLPYSKCGSINDGSLLSVINANAWLEISTKRCLGKLRRAIINDRWFPCLYYLLVHMVKGARGCQYYPYHSSPLEGLFWDSIKGLEVYHFACIISYLHEHCFCYEFFGEPVVVGVRSVEADDTLGIFVGVTNVDLRGLTRLLLSGRMDPLWGLARSYLSGRLDLS